MILISEFMDETAVKELALTHHVHYDATLVDNPDKILTLIENASTIIVRNRTQMRGELLAKAHKLKAIGRLGVGLDNIDMDECKRRGIAVFPATGANNISVAEYVMTAALTLLRPAYGSFNAMIAGEWPRNALMGGEIFGKTLGLIGYGAIAKDVEVRAKAFGMQIIAYDPYLGMNDLDSLIKAADVISLHVPLTPETHHLINATTLSKMKPTAIVINAARGGVIDELALSNALVQKIIAGAALDVFEEEPLKNTTHFKDCPNLILTPHIAGVTFDSNTRVSFMTINTLKKYLETLS